MSYLVYCNIQHVLSCFFRSTSSSNVNNQMMTQSLYSRRSSERDQPDFAVTPTPNRLISQNILLQRAPTWTNSYRCSWVQVLISSMMFFLAKLSSHHCDVTLHAAWFRGQRDTVNLSATDQRPIGREKRDAILKDGKRTSINNWTET